jgi:hypothetical protein
MTHRLKSLCCDCHLPRQLARFWDFWELEGGCSYRNRCEAENWELIHNSRIQGGRVVCPYSLIKPNTAVTELQTMKEYGTYGWVPTKMLENLQLKIILHSETSYSNMWSTRNCWSCLQTTCNYQYWVLHQQLPPGYTHPLPLRLHGVALNQLNTGTTLASLKIQMLRSCLCHFDVIFRHVTSSMLIGLNILCLSSFMVVNLFIWFLVPFYVFISF